MIRRPTNHPRHLLALAIASALCVTACKTTPAYLEKWQNREGSEQMFADHLKDPDSTMEIKVKALELLVKQWDYAVDHLRNGGVLKEMEPAVRDRTILEALEPIRAYYEAEGTRRGEVRDALHHIRLGTDSTQVHDAIDEILVDWLNNHWQPCVESGSVPLREIFADVGAEAGAPILVEVMQEGSYNDMRCALQQLQRLEWLGSNDAVATAFANRWDEGVIAEEDQEGKTETQLIQMRFSLAEEAAIFGASTAFRRWLGEKVANPETHPNLANLFADILSNNRQADDAQIYVDMLDAESISRWTAFEALVNMAGSQGLDQALSNLPAEGEYGMWDGGTPPDGFKRATAYLCTMSKMQELGDNARQVFEQHLDDENVHARIISVACLGQYGDASSVEELREAKEALGRDAVPLPRWGEEMELDDLIDASIAAIQAR